MKYEEKQVDSKQILDGKILDVRLDTVILPDGRETTRELIRHVGAVCVVPITDDGKIVAERQFRYPLGRTVLEIPAGKLNSKSEDRESAARRELKEETGIEADEMISLGDFCPACAYSDELITMYMARGLKFGEACLDEGEFLDVELIDTEDFVKMIMRGEVTDAKTQAAVLKAYLLLKGYKI